MTRIAKHIGYNVVAYGIPTKEIKEQNYIRPTMEILCTSATDENVFSPAQSITVTSADSVRALRDFCNELLGEGVKP